MFSKNLAVFLGLILFLIFGAGLGYLLSNNKSFDPSSSGIVSQNNLSSTQKQNIKTNLTANEAYDIALGEAGEWADDAYPSAIDLASKKFDASGEANGWKFNFYSKSKNKIYEVLIKDGESRGGTESAAAKASQTLKGEMVDSSVLAKSFYGTYPEDTEIISLKMYYDSGIKKFIWTIFFPKGSHTVDAET